MLLYKRAEVDTVMDKSTSSSVSDVEDMDQLYLKNKVITSSQRNGDESSNSVTQRCYSNVLLVLFFKLQYLPFYLRGAFIFILCDSRVFLLLCAYL